MRYLLDTDTCIWVLRKKEPFRSRFMAESPDDLAIASITAAELWYGARNSQQPALNRSRVEALLSLPLEILPFDGETARIHADLRYALRAQPIGPADLVIGSVAVSNHLTMVTSNVREFGRIPGLPIQNWSDS